MYIGVASEQSKEIKMNYFYKRACTICRIAYNYKHVIRNREFS